MIINKIQESSIHLSLVICPFVQLLDISLKNSKSFKTFNSEFSFVEVWLTEQNSKLLEIK